MFESENVLMPREFFAKDIEEIELFEMVWLRKSAEYSYSDVLVSGCHYMSSQQMSAEIEKCLLTLECIELIVWFLLRTFFR